MKKISFALLIYIASHNAALAYTFGPVEGGKCESCDIWIDRTTINGGRINLGAWHGWAYAESDIISFARQHCTQKGFQDVDPMPSRIYRTGDSIWFKDYSNDFTCRKPDTFLEAEYGNDGVISSLQNNIYQIQQVADRSCQKRSLGVAIVKRSSEQISSRNSYVFECHQPQPLQEIQSVIPQANLSEPSKDKMTITKAKEECKSLGFKLKTEKFGNCVLELTK